MSYEKAFANYFKCSLFKLRRSNGSSGTTGTSRTRTTRTTRSTRSPRSTGALSRSSLLHCFFAESIFKFVVAERVGGNVGVSLEDLEGIVERLDDEVESLPAFSDGSWFSERR